MRGPADPRGQFGPVAERYLTSKDHNRPDALAELVALARPSGGVVVDVATGAGLTALAFAAHVRHVIATDITPEMLKVAGEEAGRQGVTNLSLALAAAERLPFRTGSLDGITCRVAPHHFVSVRAFVEEVARCLRPGGWFALVDTAGPDDAAAGEYLDLIESVRDPSHRHNLSPGEWRSLVVGAGLTVRHESAKPKRLQTGPWLDRMAVHGPRRLDVLKLIADVPPTLAGYLDRQGEGEEGSFCLLELTVIADR